MNSLRTSNMWLAAIVAVLLVGVALVFLSVRTVLERSNGSAEAVQEADMSTR
ncbi:MAG: hypothetical protein HGA33_06810, partial [Candidatus Moranbacteria bacterium]|nr:hypothetical protein [Candidatus Moranbacteria bacterium]